MIKPSSCAFVSGHKNLCFVSDLFGQCHAKFQASSYFRISLFRRRQNNLNLNGLLVTRQTDNTSPVGGGGVAPGGKLVPGSHKRCELGHTVIRHFSRGDKRIRENKRINRLILLKF